VSRGGLRADLAVSDVPRSTVGAELAREGGLTADQPPPDVPSPTVGASLLAKAA
jgi:hypothetical protein